MRGPVISRLSLSLSFGERRTRVTTVRTDERRGFIRSMTAALHRFLLPLRFFQRDSVRFEVEEEDRGKRGSVAVIFDTWLLLDFWCLKFRREFRKRVPFLFFFFFQIFNFVLISSNKISYSYLWEEKDWYASNKDIYFSSNSW